MRTARHAVHVQSALRACPGSHSLESGPPRARRMRRRHPAPSRLPGRTASHIACPTFDSAGREGVQPAAELRHVQRHGHEVHVLQRTSWVARGALGAPRPAFSRAFLVHAPLAPPPLHAASRPAASPRAAYPPFDSAARHGFQPAAELRHVQRHGHGLHVLRALRACPAPQPSVGAFPVHAPLAPPPLQHAASRPAASPRVAYPPFDSAARHGFQPVAELRHVQRHEHAQDVQGALRACPAALGFGQTLVPLRAACAAPAPRPASRSPAPHLAPHRMPSFRLGSPRRRSTSR